MHTRIEQFKKIPFNKINYIKRDFKISKTIIF